MARNRKNQSAAIRFGPVLKALLLCLFIGGSGIGYVGQKNLIAKLGREKKQCETQLIDMRRQNKLRRDVLAGLRSPQSLDKQVKELKLELGLPQLSQKHTLIEPLSASGPGVLRPGGAPESIKPDERPPAPAASGPEGLRAGELGRAE
jgi:hypothetical protein